MRNTDRRHAVAALAAAGLLWGTTVPLSKLALEWLPPGWLTLVRFGLAAAIMLAVASRRPGALRAACTPLVLASGAFGYGGSVLVQNAGITRTSVTHAALLIGAVPVLVAVIAAVWQAAVARPVAWAGFAVSLAGVGLVAGGQGGGASAAGDGLVLVSLLLSATFTVGQVRLLRGRDPVAVTAVQFLGAALAALPFSAAEGMPSAPHGLGAAAATVALAVGGTLLPFTLFAYGQSRVSAEVAGAFVNIEPLVGAIAGIVVFGDPAGPAQALGGAAIIAGIALSTLPLLAAGSVPRRPAAPSLRGRGRIRWVARRRWSPPRRQTSGSSAPRPLAPRTRPAPTAAPTMRGSPPRSAPGRPRRPRTRRTRRPQEHAGRRRSRPPGGPPRARSRRHPARGRRRSPRPGRPSLARGRRPGAAGRPAAASRVRPGSAARAAR